MTEKTYPRLSALFRFIISKRFWILGIYALLIPPSIYFALQVKQDNSPERLMVQTDQDYDLQKSFESTFGKTQQILLYFDAPKIFTKEVLSRLKETEEKLNHIKGVRATSLLSLFQGANISQPIFGSPEYLKTLRRFAFPVGTPFLVQQRFLNAQETSLGVQVTISIENENLFQQLFQKIKRIYTRLRDTEDWETELISLRKEMKDSFADSENKTVFLSEIPSVLQQINQAVDAAQKSPSPFTNIRKIGQPYVNDYLDRDTRSAGMKYFGLFGLFVVVLTLFLYRSFRTLLAILLSLGVSTALTVGFVGVIGGVFTIVSSLIPMTVLITATATLVYIHSRFVEQPPDKSTEEHQIFSLSNKFLACTASIFATAVGFAALVVSKIKPIREMGLWVAMGLIFTWLVVFTLFPVLQRVLKTPTEQKQKIAGQWFLKLVEFLPKWSYRYRFLLVPLALLWCTVGALALFGLPHVFDKMKLETNAVEYINHQSKLYQDTKQLENEPFGGLSTSEIWLQGKPLAFIEDNPFLHPPDEEEGNPLEALEDFQKRLEADPHVTLVMGWPNLLKMFSYLYHFDRNETPKNVNDILNGVSMDVGNVALHQKPEHPDLIEAVRGFIPLTKQVQIRIIVRTKTMTYEEHQAFHQTLTQLFQETQSKHKELANFKIKITGSSMLQSKVAHYLVPTLTESFGLTVAIIFGAFLLVFRSGPARIMAMIPSLFAILAMFSIMRLAGMSLNIATILIASTVLGSSENDQIHFFYHYQERKKAGGTTEDSLKHTFLVAGRAIFFATLINAGGFLAFALADLPPIRQFGLLSSLAFVLSMIADFTALPAALWLVFRAKPDAKKTP